MKRVRFVGGPKHDSELCYSGDDYPPCYVFPGCLLPVEDVFAVEHYEDLPRTTTARYEHVGDGVYRYVVPAEVVR
jgi:hypothetical protein